MTSNPYLDVSSERPCVICGKPDWCWQTIDSTFVYCRRTLRDGGVECHDKNGDVYYLYSKGGEAKASQAPPPDDIDTAPRADAKTRDRVYNALLGHLGLSPAHRQNLRERGFSDEAITGGEYATLPVDITVRRGAIQAVAVAMDMGDLGLCSTPGFFQRESGTDIELAGTPGLLIPSRDTEGLIGLLRIRVDNPHFNEQGKPTGKYRYLSGPRGAIGCGATAQVHIPTHLPALRRSTVRITEGELKAEIATQRTGVLTIFIPGAAAFALAVPIVRLLEAKEVWLAYDADARTNPHVAKALQGCALLFAHEFGAAAVCIEVWPESAGKGIDDLLVGARANELAVHSGAATWVQIAEIARAAGAAVEPMIEARGTLAGIDARLAADIQGTAFAPDVLKAAAVLQECEKAEYEHLTGRLKKVGVRISAWEREVRKHTHATNPQSNTDRRNLPEIEVTVDEAAVAVEAISALAGSDELYQRGGMLVQVLRDGACLRSVIRQKDTPRIAQVAVSLLREFCSKRARWKYKSTSKNGITKFIEGHPPPWAVQAIQQRGHWDGIRLLEGVVEWPVLRFDGSVLSKAGYDAATGLLYAPNCDVPCIPDVPTRADVRASVAVLQDVICDFPFATPAHEAACIAAILTVFARYAFHGPAPLMLIDKSAPGTGGSLLTAAIGEISGGRPMAVMPPSPNDEEERKRITSIAISGIPIVLIDNVSGPLGTPSLDAALTATEWQDRILGRCELVRLPLNTIWFATGNNISLVGDTSQRCLHIRLESPEERPRERKGFKHDPLLPWIRANRPAIMAAALTLLRAYVVSGRPSQGLSSWGSFEGWSGLVRSCIVWVGLPDPGETRIELQTASDDAASALGDLVEGWEEVATAFGGSCTVAQAINLFEQDYDKTQYAKLRRAIEELVPSSPGQLPSARRIAAAIKKYRGRVVGGKILEKAGNRGEAGNLWQVRKVPPPTTSTGQRPPSPVSPVSPVSDSPPSNSIPADGGPRSVDGEGAGGDAGDAADTGGASGWAVRL